RLAFGRPASPPVAPLFGSPSGRPTGSLRGPRSWFSLFAHRHLHVIPHSFSPQFGVQENPRARDALREVRDTTLTLYDPLSGDNPWSHGCRVYARSCFRVKQLAQRYAWLSIIEEEPKPIFTFAIEGITIRF